MFLPAFADIDTARRARLLLIIILTFLAAVVIITIPALIIPVMQPLLPVTTAFILSFAVLLAVLRLGYVRTASLGLIIALIAERSILTVLPAVVAIRGMQMTLVLNDAIIILLAGFLVSWWTPLPASVAIGIGRSIAEALIGPAADEMGLTSAATLLALCITVSLFARSLERALSYARQQETTAQEAVARTQTLNQELEATLRETQTLLTQERTLRDTISELTVPIQQVGDGVLFAPLIGHIDTQRGQQISRTVLDQLHGLRAHTLIVDVQGISVVDSNVVTLIDQLIRAAQLLGARVMMTGVSAAMAATMTRLGISFRNVTLHTTVAAALQVATVQGQATRSTPLTLVASANGKHR